MTVSLLKLVIVATSTPPRPVPQLACHIFLVSCELQKCHECIFAPVLSKSGAAAARGRFCFAVYVREVLSRLAKFSLYRQCGVGIRALAGYCTVYTTDLG